MPPISVHVWGGLGSQLFGVVTANRLKVRFPFRRIVMVFHTSGVTKRTLAIPNNVLLQYRFIIKNDFKLGTRESESLEERVGSRTFRQAFKSITAKLGLLETLNNNTEYSRIRFWLIQVRGHYSYISITEDEIRTILSILDISPINSAPTRSLCVVHLRLGDLVNLGTKGPISPKRVVESVPLKYRDGRVLILSDSGKGDVDRFLSVESSNFSYEAYCLDLKNTFQYSVASRCFVGTNSKISIWTILLRILLEPDRETLVPFELKDNIGKLTKELKDAHKSIRFY